MCFRLYNNLHKIYEKTQNVKKRRNIMKDLESIIVEYFYK